MKLSSMVKRARANMDKSKYRRSQSLNGTEVRLAHEQGKIVLAFLCTFFFCLTDPQKKRETTS